MNYYSDVEEKVYELYKIDWLGRISTEEHVEVFLNWCEEDGYENFEEYLEERGFNGNIYACLDEFLENEFLDTEYITDLIRGCDASYSKYLDIVRGISDEFLENEFLDTEYINSLIKECDALYSGYLDIVKGLIEK